MKKTNPTPTPSFLRNPTPTPSKNLRLHPCDSATLLITLQIFMQK